MHYRLEEPAKPTLATSDAVPRAVEFLINFLLRWISFGFAVFFGLLAVAAYLTDWTWLVVVPLGLLSLLTLLFFAVATAIRPKGKIHFDGVGPSIVVPTTGSKQSLGCRDPQSSEGSESATDTN